MDSTKGDQHLIAVGLDGSDSSWKAFDEALQQAKLKSALLHVVSVQEFTEATYNPTEVIAAAKTAEEELKRIQLDARKKAKTAGIPVEMAIITGHSATALVEYAKKHHIDLIIVGDTGHSSIWGALLGNTADKIVRIAPCSVWIVRQGKP